MCGKVFLLNQIYLYLQLHSQIDLHTGRKIARDKERVSEREIDRCQDWYKQIQNRSVRVESRTINKFYWYPNTWIYKRKKKQLIFCSIMRHWNLKKKKQSQSNVSLSVTGINTGKNKDSSEAAGQIRPNKKNIHTSLLTCVETI